jgi:predicted dienelactone hydrolase
MFSRLDRGPLPCMTLCSVLRAGALLLGFLCAHAAVAGAVGEVNRHYVDEHRRNWDGNGPRPLEAAIWYPAKAAAAAAEPKPNRPLFETPVVVRDAVLADAHKKYPLILISHGTGGCAGALLWMGHYLASHGYLVAAINHHGNTCAEAKPDPRGYLLWWERAQDVRVALDRVLADPEFGTHIDPRRIGALGFSLGGYTVITVAGARIERARYLRFCSSSARDFTCGPQAEYPDALKLFEQLEKTDPLVQEALKHSGDSYRDPRVRAVLALAPVFGGGFAAKDVADIHIPVEIVVGAADTVAPPATNAERYASLIPGARLIEMPGQVGHYDFVPSCTEDGKKMAAQMNIERLCYDDPSVDRRAVQNEARSLALEFFNRNLAAKR